MDYNLFDFIKNSSLKDIKKAISSTKIYRGDFGTVLNLAIYLKKLDLLKYLIEEKFEDISFCLTPSYIISLPQTIGENPDLDIFKYLIDKNIIGSEDLEKTNILSSMLYRSKNDSCLDLVKFMIEEKKYNLKLENDDKNSLVQCCCHHNPLTTKYLIDNGADVKVNNYLPFSFAASSGSVDMLKILEQNGGEPVANTNGALFGCIDYLNREESTANTIVYLIKKGWNIDEKQDENMILVSDKELEEIQRMIDYINLDKELSNVEKTNKNLNKI